MLECIRFDENGKIRIKHLAKNDDAGIFAHLFEKARSSKG